MNIRGPLHLYHFLDTIDSTELVVFLFLDSLEYRKCLETGEMTKSLEYNYFFKGFGRFLCFLTLLNTESV